MANQKKKPKKPDHLSGADTEKKILAAARAEFADCGLEGARMQSIADHAGVNKALLHYYFRSKEKLFQRVFRELATTVWGDVQEKMSHHPGVLDLRALIRSIVTAYITTIAATPEFARMLMRELANGGPNLSGVASEIMAAMGDLPAGMIALVEREYQKKNLRRFEPVHLIMNIMGMCAATFFFQPIASAIKSQVGSFIIFDSNFYTKRIEIVVETICDGIFVKGTR